MGAVPGDPDASPGTGLQQPTPAHSTHLVDERHGPILKGPCLSPFSSPTSDIPLSGYPVRYHFFRKLEEAPARPFPYARNTSHPVAPSKAKELMMPTTAISSTANPQVVSREAWQSAHKALLAKEKAYTRAGDALAAERRRQPMVEITKPYSFEGPEGTISLLDLFEGRSQLIIYHFMFAPGWDEGCVGCSMVVDHFGPPAHLHARDTSRVLISRAPLAKFMPFKKRMGWTEPWVSSFGTDFNVDFGATTASGDETHPLSVLLRDGNRIFLTYASDDRGCEFMINSFALLDRTSFGRQESWEDSPAGRPQTPPYEWWRLHDRYEGVPQDDTSDACCH